MFNHHFFNGTESQEKFSEFLTEKENKHVAIVTDPPFGGLVEVLASTLNRIFDEWKQLMISNGNVLKCMHLTDS